LRAWILGSSAPLFSSGLRPPFFFLGLGISSLIPLFSARSFTWSRCLLLRYATQRPFVSGEVRHCLFAVLREFGGLYSLFGLQRTFFCVAPHSSAGWNITRFLYTMALRSCFLRYVPFASYLKDRLNRRSSRSFPHGGNFLSQFFYWVCLVPWLFRLPDSRNNSNNPSLPIGNSIPSISLVRSETRRLRKGIVCDPYRAPF